MVFNKPSGNKPVYFLTVRKGFTVLRYLTLFVIFCACQPVAAEWVGSRKIIAMGCHNTDSICYIEIDGAAVGPANCRGNSIRWDSSTTPGKNQFALLLSAYHAAKPISLNVADSCFSMQSNFPTFSYSYI